MVCGCVSDTGKCTCAASMDWCQCEECECDECTFLISKIDECGCGNPACGCFVEEEN